MNEKGKDKIRDENIGQGILYLVSSTIMDISVDTFEQNNRFSYGVLSVIERTSFFVSSQTPLSFFFNVEIRSVDTGTWLQH